MNLTDKRVIFLKGTNPAIVKPIFDSDICDLK